MPRNSLARLAALAAVCAASAAATGCAAPTPETARAVMATPLPDVELPLSIDVDSVAVRHGALKITASIEDGSPDVSLWVGPRCDKREIGHGIATRTGFVWRLGGDDLARALACDVTVRVRVTLDDGGHALRVRTLPVSSSLFVEDGDGVRVAHQETGPLATRLGFVTTSRATRLSVGGVLVGADDTDDDAKETERNEDRYRSRFEVSNDDLARVILSRRRVVLLGATLATVVTVGRTSLDLADDAAEEIVVGEGDG